MTSSDASIWPRAKEFIKKELDNDQVFNIWFGPLKFVSSKEDSITLEVQNKLFQEMLLDRYATILNSSVAKACGRDMKVEFVLKESGDTAQQPGRDAPKAESKPFAYCSEYSSAYNTPRKPPYVP